MSGSETSCRSAEKKISDQIYERAQAAHHDLNGVHPAIRPGGERDERCPPESPAASEQRRAPSRAGGPAPASCTNEYTMHDVTQRADPE